MLKEKLCKRCNEVKNSEEFTKRPDRKSGLYSICKNCKNIYRHIKYTHDKKSDPINLWINKNFIGVRSRAKCKKIEFDIDKSHLINLLEKQTYCCIYCSNPFNFQGKRNDKSKSPTIDKILPNMGYTKSNTVICCHRCNFIKSDASYLELRKISEVLESLVINI